MDKDIQSMKRKKMIRKKLKILRNSKIRNKKRNNRKKKKKRKRRIWSKNQKKRNKKILCRLSILNRGWLSRLKRQKQFRLSYFKWT